MQKVVHKLFWIWDFDKEEAWLNKMADQGWELCEVGVCKYVFKECKPSQWTIRLELLENCPFNKESQSYIHFLEETRIEFIGSIMRWVYFKKNKADGEFDLYSGIMPRIAYLNRMLVFQVAVIFCLLSSGLLNLSLGIHESSIGNLVIGLFIVCLSLFLLGSIVKVIKHRNLLKKESLLHD